MERIEGIPPIEVDRESLFQPIPNLDKMRELKQGYLEVPINISNYYFGEPVIDITDYAIAGQAYYSRKNAATGDAVEGVPKELFLRKTILEKLAAINNALANPQISSFFGGEVELYVEDAYRDADLQKQLHDYWFPKLIREQNPGFTDEQVANRVKDMIAIPSIDLKRPSPHVTGGAFDAILRFKQPEPGFAEGVNVPMGHFDGETSDRILPDYFETRPFWPEEDALAQKNRRAYYAIMTGEAFGIDTYFANNPTEWWHWSYGDQMWAKLKDQATAIYSVAKIE